MKLGNTVVIAIMLASVAALAGNDSGQWDKQRQKSSARMTPLDQQFSPPTVAQSPEDLCDGEWHGPAAAYDPGWFIGQEYYAVYQDPIEMGCTDTYPFEVTNVYWSVYNNTPSEVTVEMQPVIYAVDLSNPTCPKPGVVLRRGPLSSILIPAGAISVVALPLDVACCVTGPYFAGVECPTYLGTASMAILLDDGGTSLRDCANYNNYRGLWEDLVVGYAFTGNLKLWSDGYNSTQNTCDDCPSRIEAGDNLWESDRDGNLLPSPISPPIPADFFGPGSDPFEGTIDLTGGPLPTDPPGILGPTDAVIRRLAPLDGSDPGSDPQTIAIELVALSLVGVDPISVTYNGGQDVEFWDIQVCLSKFAPSSGTIEVSFDCCEGGDIDLSDIQIQPLFAFTRQSDQERRILDYGLEGLPPVPCEITAGEWTGEISWPVDPVPVPVTSPGLMLVDDDCDPATNDILIQPSSQFLFTGNLGETWLPEPCMMVSSCFESIGQIAFTDSPSAACEDPSGLRIGHLSSALSQPGQIEVEPGPYVPGQVIQTEIVQLELSGTVPGLGDIIIRERADKASTGEFEVLETDAEGNIIAADGWYEFWPEAQMDWPAPTVNTGDEPLTLHAVWQEGLAEEPLPIQADFVADADSLLPVELVDADSGVPFGWICGMLWRPTLALPCNEPRPTGACCAEDNSCAETTQVACESNGWYYSGDGATCDTTACPPTLVEDTLRPWSDIMLGQFECKLVSFRDEAIVELCNWPYHIHDPVSFETQAVVYAIWAEWERVAILGDATANPGEFEGLLPLIVRQRPDKTTQGRIDVGDVDVDGNLTAGRIYMDFFPEFEIVDSGVVLNTGDIPFRIESEIIDMKLTGATLSPRPSAAPLRLITSDNEHWGWVCNFSISDAPAPVGDPFVGLEFSQGDYNNGDPCCCEGRVGDANGLGGDEPTIGDISVMIDALFISGDPNVIACLAEADINQSGGFDPQSGDITIGDISVLIDYLFITGPSLGLAECL